MNKNFNSESPLLRFLFVLLVLFFYCETKLYSQNPLQLKNASKPIIAKYISPGQDVNKFTSESMLLYADSTFAYSLKTEFFKINASGYWYIFKNELILNSQKKKSKQIVLEKTEKSTMQQKIKFDVAYKDGNPMNYKLYLISNKDTVGFKDVFGDTVIKNYSSFIGFYVIDSRGLKYPTYFIKNKKSNNFIIKLEVDRIFDNEKWKILDNNLEPIELNGKYAEYLLNKIVS